MSGRWTFHGNFDKWNHGGYKMIKSFAHKGLEDFFFEETTKGIQAKHAQKLAMLLDRLDMAAEALDMRFPGSDLHALKGDRKSTWAVKVSGNWRLFFRFEDGDAHAVDYIDY